MKAAARRLIAPGHDPKLEAIRHADRSYTHAHWEDAALRYAAGLSREGIKPGDRVAVLSDNRPEVLFVTLGHLLSGVIHVPINTRYRAPEIEHILDDSGACAVVVDAAHLDVLDEVDPTRARRRIHLGTPDEDRLEEVGDEPRPTSPPGEDPTAVLIYTSGTTGKSKGVELTHRAIGEGIGRLTDLWGWSSEDRLVLGLPLFHVHGLGIGVYGARIHGLCIDLLPRFEASQVVESMRQGASIFMGVPTMYAMLLEHLEREPQGADALRGARLFTSGSAALPAHDFERFEQLTGHRILERYGMTETLLTLSNPLDGERRPGSVGRPLPGCEIRVVDDAGEDIGARETGELWVRWPGLMTGYWNNPQATAEAFTDGWFRTGDVVVRDPDGYIRIVGRSSVDIIKSGGFKISAREIEEVVAQHPNIKEAAIVGLPDARWGERIAVAVVLRAPFEAAQLHEDLSAHVAARLADYKKPREMLIVDELPRNALGKLQKHRIIALFEREGASRAP